MWWDERVSGGRTKGYIYLLHPGPSILVTATFVAVAGIAMRAMPSPLRALQLAAVMLPLQFAIGITNDIADHSGDAVSKPYKPIPRGLVGVQVASALSIVLIATGVVVAATINWATFALAVAGSGAGLVYNAGLKRTSMPWIAWWAGFVALPAAAFAAANALSTRVLWIVPFSGLLALGLYLANAAPDVEGDRGARGRSLAVRLGARRGRQLAVAAIGTAGVLAIAVAWIAWPISWWLPAGGGLLLAALVFVTATRSTRPFPVLAAGSAVFAIAWLASLPTR